MSEHTQEDFDPLENNIQASAPFQYPSDKLPEELWALVQTHVSSSMAMVMIDMLSKLANFALPADNPRLALAALFYASDVDLSYILQCENSETAISKRLGIGKQTFNTALRKVRSEFGLYHSVTINHGVTKATYQNNAKKLPPQ